MTDLFPLKSASHQAVSRLLLESALEDCAPPGAAERALHALSLGAIATTTVVTAHAAASSSASSHVVGALVLKWLGLGLLAGTVTVVSAERVMHALSEVPTTPAAPSQPTELRMTRQTNRVASLAPAQTAPESTPPAAKTEPKIDTREFRAAAPPFPAPEVAQPAADPLQQLRTIRRALAEHAPLRALSLVDEFVARHPSSSLLEEAAVLRFDALLAQHSSDAQAEGQNFLLRYPHSAYAQRVRVELSGSGDQSAQAGH